MKRGGSSTPSRREDRERLRASGPSSSLGVFGAELHQQRRRLGGSSFQRSGVPGMFQAAAISVGATISSVALAPAATSAGTTVDGGVDVLEERTATSVVWRLQRDRLEDRLGEERERALRADQQPPEDLQRLRRRRGTRTGDSRSCS